MRTEFETVIGVEVHVELDTKTKIFCGCKNAFGEKPNTNICPVCSGMPGSLPVLNRKVLEHAIRVGLATNCGITEYTRFDRKNYYYPDNPQNYQISQLYAPLCVNGYLDIETGAGAKRIGIKEIHMEEDAGKLIHNEENNTSLVDYNRSGVPLIEIVTNADMRNSEEVVTFLKKLRLIILYLGASDCNLSQGSMRVDVNLSVREAGQAEFGTRTEMKNLNSFKAIKNAIEAESKRQIELLQTGNEILQEARRWDDLKGVSYSMRLKEDYREYMYFPDPDLPVVHVSDEMVSDLKQGLPELREEKVSRYIKDYHLPEYDAYVLTESLSMAKLFEKTVEMISKPKEVSNWLMVETKRLCKEKCIDEEAILFSPKNLATLIEMTGNGEITGTVAKEIFEQIFLKDVDPKDYARKNNLITVTNEDELRAAVLCVIDENQRSVSDYKNGKEKALGFLVGQSMKRMNGRANANRIKEILHEYLD